MAFREFERLSPNRDETAHERLGVLFHHSQLGYAETIERMLNPASQVSYHCLIDLDGTRCTLVPETQVAWHAGASRFMGRSRCNDFLLGVAFAGDTYLAPLSSPQIASALEWLEARWAPLGWGGGPHHRPPPGLAGPQARPEPRGMGAALRDRLRTLRTVLALKAVSMLKSHPTRSRKIQPQST